MIRVLNLLEPISKRFAVFLSFPVKPACYHYLEKMKKVTLILPDKIDRVIGSSRAMNVTKEDISAESIKQVLCDRSEYHLYYRFPWNDVFVLSIEEYEPKE